MLKRLATLFAAAGSIVLLFCALFSSLQLAMNDSDFIAEEYRRLSLSKAMGVSTEDLTASCIRLIDYMEGRVDSIDIEVTVNGERDLMFREPQEISHMADVRLLYQKIRNYRDYGILVALVLYLLAAVLHFRTAPHTLASGHLWGSFAFALAGGFLGTWAALDFTNFWTFFHEALFWNDDWLFDPRTSRMINMMPEKFFSDFILRMAIPFAAVFLVLVIFALLVLSHYRKQRRKAAQGRAK